MKTALVSAIGLAAAPAAAAPVHILASDKLTPPETFGLFVAIPAVAFAVIAFLVYLPSMIRGPRYRPGLPWTADSVWFSGPADPREALEAVPEVVAVPGGGGASARW